MIGGMFGEWLEDQQHRGDDVGRFARLCWEDYTSGCARYYATALQWKAHFEMRHSTKLDVIIPLLKASYENYLTSLLPTTE